jgi:hypothetical protein
MRFVARPAEFKLDFTKYWPQPFVAKNGPCIGDKVAAKSQERSECIEKRNLS